MEKGKAVTIKDVAKWADVSVATVSRYLNNTRKFPSETIRKIDAAISELGYVPNANARSLKQNKTGILGIIVPDMIIYGYMCRTIENNLFDKDYNVIICNTGYAPEKEHTFLQKLQQQRVDGIFIASCGKNNNLIRKIAVSGTPIVMFDRYIPELPELNYVLERGKECTRKLTEFAVSCGHKAFAYMKGPLEFISNERFNEFLRILNEHNIAPNPRYYYDSVITSNEIVKVSNDIIDNINDISIVLTTNAKQIKYFIMTAHQRGLSIPEDISITGFGLSEYKHLWTMPTTCIIQNHRDIGIQCVNKMIQLIDNPKLNLSGEITYVENEFNIGSSVMDLTTN